ncbi:uncharacterized protein LOC131437490 [Malaya genurostris]|uniref:uncharacterized protein LOC131437490 n=1 Tax=Malaya genurostris TaxID=325434 RepID=UPI0026F38FAB|nr:uncharacterized protein LOC131437490 [Malaya genurostris]
MYERCRSSLNYYVMLGLLVIAVDSSAYYLSDTGQFASRNSDPLFSVPDYDDLGNSLNSVGPSDHKLYPVQVTDKRRHLDDHKFASGYANNNYDGNPVSIEVVQRSDPRSDVQYEMWIADRKYEMIRKTLKLVIFLLLLLAIPASVVLFVIIPLKVLIAMKLAGIVNIVGLIAWATRNWSRRRWIFSNEHDKHKLSLGLTYGLTSQIPSFNPMLLQCLPNCGPINWGNPMWFHNNNNIGGINNANNNVDFNKIIGTNTADTIVNNNDISHNYINNNKNSTSSSSNNANDALKVKLKEPTKSQVHSLKPVNKRKNKKRTLR